MLKKDMIKECQKILDYYRKLGIGNNMYVLKTKNQTFMKRLFKNHPKYQLKIDALGVKPWNVAVRGNQRGDVEFCISGSNEPGNIQSFSYRSAVRGTPKDPYSVWNEAVRHLVSDQIENFAQDNNLTSDQHIDHVYPLVEFVKFVMGDIIKPWKGEDYVINVTESISILPSDHKDYFKIWDDEVRQYLYDIHQGVYVDGGLLQVIDKTSNLKKNRKLPKNINDILEKALLRL